MPYPTALGRSSLGRLLFSCWAFAISLQAANGADPVDFDREVAPLLAQRCLDCHSGNTPKGGLSLEVHSSALKGGESGKALVPKNLTASLLWQRITADEMPPKHPLTPPEKELVARWIKQGAVWGANPIDRLAHSTSQRAGRDWWSLQALPLPPQIPQVQSPWVATEIDAFVWKQLAEHGLSPAPPASPRALIRRLYFDLVGLPPPPGQIEAFAANPTKEAYETIVDDLLATPQYGERWGRHWLDVVRFGESNGFERNEPRKNAWPYRDWVVNALNADMPYDQFVQMQLIGDLLQKNVEGASATGFWVAGVHNTVVGGSKRMKDLARQDELEEVLATVGQTFLGLTVNCARCHDHKFDPVTQKEFYQLASAISGLGFGERTEKSPEDAERLRAVEAQQATLNQKLVAIENPARKAIIAARRRGEFDKPEPPTAFARWEFDGDLRDAIGTLHGTAIGNAKTENGALLLDGTSFVQTPPLKQDIQEKTLAAWVELTDLNQAGGGAISIETLDGKIFDSIVFGEREPQRWMPGSNGFVRSESFRGPAEAEANKRPVHFAIVYRKDGTIVGYRDGKPYGQPAGKGPLQNYASGAAELVFGLRHKPTGSNKHLKAKLHQATFYDRALSAAEVAVAAGNAIDYVTEEQLVQSLDPKTRNLRADLQRQATLLQTKADRLRQSANRKIYTMTPRQGARTNVLLRGDPERQGDLVAAGGVAAIAGVTADFGLAPDAPEAERRRALAKWITDGNNPLFSRVIANRIWHYHFGQGLVITPNDFGFNGGHPTHPELLDWLAVWFRDNGYRMKAFHRLIVTSNTWKQAGYPPLVKGQANPRDQDADNRLLWRMTPRRLEAECVRDAMLAVAGKLDPHMGGPSFEDVSIVSNNGTTYYEPRELNRESHFRRTIYRFNPRGGRSALLDTFDCPDPAATAPRRAVTTTPLQALSLLNNSFVLRMSTEFAARVESQAGKKEASQIQLAWQLALARDPTPDERAWSAQLVRQHGLAALCRGLFNANEFVIIE